MQACTRATESRGWIVNPTIRLPKIERLSSGFKTLIFFKVFIAASKVFSFGGCGTSLRNSFAFSLGQYNLASITTDSKGILNNSGVGYLAIKLS